MYICIAWYINMYEWIKVTVRNSRITLSLHVLYVHKCIQERERGLLINCTLTGLFRAFPLCLSLAPSFLRRVPYTHTTAARSHSYSLSRTPLRIRRIQKIAGLAGLRSTERQRPETAIQFNSLCIRCWYSVCVFSIRQAARERTSSFPHCHQQNTVIQ